MAALVCLLLVFLMVGGSDAAWCVCKSDQSNPALQKTLDYACGAGADCSPIIQNGVCYNPNSVLAHCSYAANSYYQRKGQAQQACDFTGTAMLTTSDPSPGGGCTFPATPSAAGTSSTPNTTPGSSATPGSTLTPGSSTTPGSTLTPSTGTGTGTGTGVVGGLGPTGTTSYDGSDGGFLPMAKMSSLLIITFILPMALMRS